MSNQSIREQLQILYGCRCMLTGDTNDLSFHHIVKKQFSGKDTVENGALLTTQIHRWLHRQEDNETYDLIEECLDMYKVCLETNRKECLLIYQNEVMPLLKKEVKKTKKYKK